MFDVSLPLVIEWPNGTRLPVRVAPTATGEDLMKLLHFAGFRYHPFLLVVAGNYINPELELTRQMVRHNSVIRVVRISAVVEPAEAEPETDGFDGACAEMLRIVDMQFNNLEGHKKGGLIYRSILSENTETVETHSERGTTICPLPAAYVSTDPLPEPIRTSDSEMDESDSDDWPPSHSGDRNRPFFEPNRVQREWNW
jgi:hypothetical protein